MAAGSSPSVSSHGESAQLSEKVLIIRVIKNLPPHPAHLLLFVSGLNKSAVMLSQGFRPHHTGHFFFFFPLCLSLILGSLCRTGSLIYRHSHLPLRQYAKTTILNEQPKQPINFWGPNSRMHRCVCFTS